MDKFTKALHEYKDHVKALKLKAGLNAAIQTTIDTIGEEGLIKAIEDYISPIYSKNNPNIMTQLQKTIQAIAALQNEIDLLINSGELPQEHNELFTELSEPLEGIKNALNKIQNTPVKKKNLITGEFNIRGGYYDFKESGSFRIEIFNGKLLDLSINGSPLPEQFMKMLEHFFQVRESDIILNKWFVDLNADTLKFAFAFQTDLEFETPRNEISLITPKKLSFGSFHQNKAIFLLSELKEIPDSIWDYPCYGFAIPNTWVGNITLFEKIESAIQEGGERADLRAFTGTVFKSWVEELTEKLKAKKWKFIFTNGGKYKLLPNGNYLKY